MGEAVSQTDHFDQQPVNVTSAESLQQFVQSERSFPFTGDVLGGVFSSVTSEFHCSPIACHLIQVVPCDTACIYINALFSSDGDKFWYSHDGRMRWDSMVDWCQCALFCSFARHESPVSPAPADDFFHHYLKWLVGIRNATEMATFHKPFPRIVVILLEAIEPNLVKWTPDLALLCDATWALWQNRSRWIFGFLGAVLKSRMRPQCVTGRPHGPRGQELTEGGIGTAKRLREYESMKFNF
jgi:hypothetical protein